MKITTLTQILTAGSILLALTACQVGMGPAGTSSAPAQPAPPAATEPAASPAAPASPAPAASPEAAASPAPAASPAAVTASPAA